jgi:hypothetical protein
MGSRASAFVEVRITPGQILRVISKRNKRFWPQLQLGKSGEHYGTILPDLKDRHVVGH